MYRHIAALLLSFFISSAFAQEKVVKVDYKFAFASEHLEQLGDDADSSLAMLTALAAAFAEDDQPQIQTWANKDFMRIETHGIGRSIQITDRRNGESYSLYPDMQIYTPANDATDKVSVMEQEDDLMVISSADRPVNFIADSTRTIAGYPCKLAVLDFSDEAADTELLNPRIEIWYTEALPQVYWGEYAYLKNVPGAALYIGAFGVGIEASAVETVDFDAALFSIPEGYTEQEDAFALPDGDSPIGEGIYTYQDFENHLLGLRDEAGNVLTQPLYSSINEFVGDYAVVSNADFQYGLINIQGEEVIPCVWEYLVLDAEEGVLNFSKNEKTGVMTVEQEVLIPADYDYISNFMHGYATFIDGEENGLLNLQAERLLQTGTSMIASYDKQQAVVVKDEHYVLLNIASGKQVGAAYDYLALPDEGELVLALKDELYGFINRKGETVIPFQFVYASPFFGGIATVGDTEEGEIRGINMAGEPVAL